MELPIPYHPAPVPTAPEQLARFLDSELHRLQVDLERMSQRIEALENP